MTKKSNAGRPTSVIINKLVKESLEHKYQILDDFCKAYIASRINEKGFDKKVHKLVLIQKQTSDPLVTKYWFEIKKGKTRKEI